MTSWPSRLSRSETFSAIGRAESATLSTVSLNGAVGSGWLWSTVSARPSARSSKPLPTRSLWLSAMSVLLVWFRDSGQGPPRHPLLR
ncbi:MAG: hypothetical protein LBS56_04090, partial [Propionibacteriaceae bacterium]|nr:hypothetical protein [Propionibacteriaceae bacterium]